MIRFQLMDYDDLSEDDPLGYVEVNISELKEGVEQTHNLQIQSGEGTLYIVTKFTAEELVTLLAEPTKHVDPSTFEVGAMQVIEAYGTPQPCLDYIVETKYVTSHMLRVYSLKNV